MRPFISCFLLISLSIQIALANAASAAGNKYFEMPVREWLGLSEGEKGEGIRALLALNNRTVSQGQIEAVAACMNTIGRSSVWVVSTVGTLLTKCSFDMGVAKSLNEAEWDALVTCIQKEVPDFSKDELFSLALSAAGASMAKDSESVPFLTPRTKKILELVDRCAKH
jgi:hypothetical protein